MISNIGMYFLTMSTPLWVAAAFNVIRNIAIGSLMMPLLTWGTSNVHPTKMADASSLLTSLRTIAGSIGSAVFVGIMTVVSTASAEVYGDNAMMHGIISLDDSRGSGTASDIHICSPGEKIKRETEKYKKTIEKLRKHRGRSAAVFFMLYRHMTA